MNAGPNVRDGFPVLKQSSSQGAETAHREDAPGGDSVDLSLTEPREQEPASADIERSPFAPLGILGS